MDASSYGWKGASDQTADFGLGVSASTGANNLPLCPPFPGVGWLAAALAAEGNDKDLRALPTNSFRKHICFRLLPRSLSPLLVFTDG